MFVVRGGVDCTPEGGYLSLYIDDALRTYNIMNLCFVCESCKWCLECVDNMDDPDFGVTLQLAESIRKVYTELGGQEAFLHWSCNVCHIKCQFEI